MNTLYNERDIHFIFDHIPQSILVFEDCKCINVNKSSVKLFGAKSKIDFLNKRYEELVSTEINLNDLEIKSKKGNFLELEYKCFDNNTIKLLTNYNKIQIEEKIFIILNIYKNIDSKIVKDLKKQLDNKIDENNQLNTMLTQQNKLATFGEMLGNIAHQWRQPLMEISSLFMTLDAKILMEKEISNDELKNVINKVNDITKFMSNTIDDFKHFHSQSKIKEKFNIAKQIGFIVSLISSTIKKENIYVDIVIKDNVYVHSYRNEFLQVILNLIINAKDVFNIRKIEKKILKVIVKSDDDNAIIVIEDNAGGIDIKPITKIFEPYFSSKLDKKGTGMGLFMSKVIVEKNMLGKLNVENTQSGAKFSVIVPKAIK